MRAKPGYEVFETNHYEPDRGKKYTLTENALKNLVSTYASHRIACEEFDKEDDLDNPEYLFDLACCQTAEDWMRAIGIHPESNFVTDIIEKERERR